MAQKNPEYSPEDEELFEALESGNIDNVELVWTKLGEDVNGIYALMTPLTRASCKGHLAEVKILLQNGADVNETDKVGDTPLLTSCPLGHSDVAVELIKRGADVNMANRNGSNPLMFASRLKELKVSMEWNPETA